MEGREERGRESLRRLERDGWLDWNGYSNLILIGMIDFGSFRCTGRRGGKVALNYWFDAWRD